MSVTRGLYRTKVCAPNTSLIPLIAKPDLWEFPEHLRTSSIANKVEANFFQRCPPEQRPSFLRPQTPDFLPPPSLKDSVKASDHDLETSYDYVPGGKKKPVYDSSLARALHETFFYRWWFAGLLKLGSGASSRLILIDGPFLTHNAYPDTLRATAPLVTRIFLAWLAKSYTYYHLTDAEKAVPLSKRPQGIGYGIGLAFALFSMQGGSGTFFQWST